MAIDKGVLQPAAPGLLSALQLKQKGKNPDTLSDTVVPMLDLTHWYNADVVKVESARRLLDPTQKYSGLTEMTAPGALVVPDNEIWWLRSAVAHIFLEEGDGGSGAGVNVQQLAACVQTRQLDIGGQGPGLYMGPIYDAGGFTFTPSGWVYSEPLRDIWAPPGAKLLVLFSGETENTGLDSTQYLQISAIVDKFLV